MIGKMAGTTECRIPDQNEEGRRKVENGDAGVEKGRASEKVMKEDGAVECGDEAEESSETETVVARRKDKGKGMEMVPPLLPPSENLFRTLPTEIVVRVLSHLTPHELVQSASCCREVRLPPRNPHTFFMMGTCNSDRRGIGMLIVVLHRLRPIIVADT